MEQLGFEFSKKSLEIFNSKLQANNAGLRPSFLSPFDNV